MSPLHRRIQEHRLIRWLLRQSRELRIPGFDGIPLYDVIKIFIKEVQKDRLNDRAASISFFFLLAMPPTLIFLFTLLPFIPLSHVEQTIYEVLHDLTPNQSTYRILRAIVYDFFHTQRKGLLSVAFLIAIFSSSTAVLGILRSFHKMHPSFRKRNILQQRWMAIKLNSLLIALVMISVSLIIAQNAIFSYLFSLLGITNETIKFLIGVARWIIIVLLFFSLISSIYTFGPATRKRWRFVSAGSMLATALTILTTLGFSYYVNHFSSYNRIYGSIGSVIVLMLWIFLNSLILLIGFELNASIDMLKKEREQTVDP